MLGYHRRLDIAMLLLCMTSQCIVLGDMTEATEMTFTNSTLVQCLLLTSKCSGYAAERFDFGAKVNLYITWFYLIRLETNTWSLVAATGRVPRPRYRSSLVVHNHTCVLFGGHDGSRHLNDVHVYDFDTRVWSLLATEGVAPIARDSHVAVIFSNSMYIFGGSTGTAVNDFYELNLESAAWQPMQFSGPPPGQRFCHVGSVYDASLIIFGGYDGSSRLNDFKQFRFGDEELQLDIPESTIINDLRMLVNNDIMSDVTFIGT